ncbi:hypothetical protein GGI17_000253 [Coemansia sp. S146]|nr:hypothetical protein GGI17_000253 [Coemansia sp. S146]
MAIALGKEQTGALSNAATAPSDVLQLIYSYLSPAPHPRCAPKDLLTHLQSIQIAAAVNRQWRATALPTFYRTVHVVIGDAQTKAIPVNFFANMGTRTYREPDYQKDADPPTTGVDIKLRTNIELLHAMGQADNVREVHIIVQGLGQTAVQIMHQLQLAGFGGGKTVWPGVERLRIDTRYGDYNTQTKERQDFGPEYSGCNEIGTGHIYHKAFNELLSRALPSLREIEYYGDFTVEIYSAVPINGLIYERLHGSTPLRALRIAGDCGPDVSNENRKKREPDAPVRIERLEIDTAEGMFSMSMPPIMASSLVELKLEPTIVDEVWKPFVSEVVPTSNRAHLQFSSLKTLKLGFSSIHEHFLNKPAGSRTFDLSSSDGDSLFAKVKPRFMRSANYGRPKFPVLTSLEIRYFPRNLKKFLTLFAASPISSLVICDTPFTANIGLDMSKFHSLRSLDVRVTEAMNLREATNINGALSAIFSTVTPDLQHLTLAMDIGKGLGLQLEVPPFADSLSSLTLEGEYGQRDVKSLLQLFPHLRILNVCAIVSEPITTVLNLVDEYRRSNTAQLLAPLSSSLRVMSVYDKRYFTGYGGSNRVSHTNHTPALGLDNYRGLLVGLVCRLPTLDTLRVGAKYLDGVHESVNALVDASSGPENIDCLGRLRVQPLDR